METVERADAWVERANDLYWSSAKRVDEIVDDLGISRSSLYTALEPIPAGLMCTDCRVRMVYSNRTARERRTAVCPACGRESEAGEFSSEVGRDDGRVVGGWRGEAEAVRRLRGMLAAVPPERVVMVGGAAALGMALGALAARAVREGW